MRTRQRVWNSGPDLEPIAWARLAPLASVGGIFLFIIVRAEATNRALSAICRPNTETATGRAGNFLSICKMQIFHPLLLFPFSDIFATLQ